MLRSAAHNPDGSVVRAFLSLVRLGCFDFSGSR
jgi:hypothetical protein